MHTRVTIVCLYVFLLGCSNSDQRIRLADVDTSEVTLPGRIDSVLGDAHATELLSMNPEPLNFDPEYMQTVPADKRFHGFEILGRVQLERHSENALIQALKAGIATQPGMAAACFNPRHALRITNSETVIDILICFECAQIQVYESDERIGGAGTSDLPREFFDTVVRKEKLRMPAPPKS